VKNPEKYSHNNRLLAAAFAACLVAAGILTIWGITALLTALVILGVTGLALGIAVRNRRLTAQQAAVVEPDGNIAAKQHLPTLVGLSQKTFEQVVLPRLAKKKVIIEGNTTLKRITRLDRVLLAPVCIGVVLMLTAATQPTITVPLPHYRKSALLAPARPTHRAKPHANHKHKSRKAHTRPTSKHPPPKKKEKQTVAQTLGNNLKKGIDKAFDRLFSSWHPTTVHIWWLLLIVGGLLTLAGSSLATKWLWTFWLIDDKLGIVKFHLPPSFFVLEPEDIVLTHKVSFLGIRVWRTRLGKLLGYGAIRLNTLLDTEEEEPLKKISPLPDPEGFMKDAMPLIDPSINKGPVASVHA